MAVNLAELDGLYNETPAATDGLPTGIYQGRIIEAHMKETKEQGYPMLELKLKVAVGPHAGRVEFFRIVFRNTEDSLKYAKRDLLKLGYKGPLSQLEAALEDFIDVGMEFKVQDTVKNGEARHNVYLSKQVAIAAGDDTPPGDFTPPAEDEHF